MEGCHHLHVVAELALLEDARAPQRVGAAEESGVGGDLGGEAAVVSRAAQLRAGPCAAAALWQQGRAGLSSARGAPVA